MTEKRNNFNRRDSLKMMGLGATGLAGILGMPGARAEG